MQQFPSQMKKITNSCRFEKCLNSFQGLHVQRLVPCFKKSQRRECSLAAGLCDVRFATVQLNLLPSRQNNDLFDLFDLLFKRKEKEEILGSRRAYENTQCIWLQAIGSNFSTAERTSWKMFIVLPPSPSLKPPQAQCFSCTCSFVRIVFASKLPKACDRVVH